MRGIFIISQICEILFITESNNQSLHFLIYCMTFQGPWQHNVLTMALKYSYACDLPYMLYLSVVPITFSRITPKNLGGYLKNEVNLKICPKITSFNFSLDKWFLKPNFPSVFHSQVITQEKCFPSGKFIAILVTQRKLQVTRKG